MKLWGSHDTSVSEELVHVSAAQRLGLVHFTLGEDVLHLLDRELDIIRSIFWCIAEVASAESVVASMSGATTCVVGVLGRSHLFQLICRHDAYLVDVS
jgi:hypothetical protein